MHFAFIYKKYIAFAASLNSFSRPRRQKILGHIYLQSAFSHSKPIKKSI